MCSIDKSIDKVSRYLWYRDTKKYRDTRYQYREILVSRYIEVSSVSPIPTWRSADLHEGAFIQQAASHQLSAELTQFRCGYFSRWPTGLFAD